ncbi:MAG: hypothetical protein ACYCUM_12340 [Solirubrobacteraceae bacterium]
MKIAEAMRNELPLPAGLPAEPCTELWVRCLAGDLQATVGDLKLAAERDLRTGDAAARQSERMALVRLLRWCSPEHSVSRTYTIELPRCDGGADRFVAEGACVAVEDEPGTWSRCCTVMLWRFGEAGELEGVVELLCRNIAFAFEPDSEAVVLELAFEQAYKYAALVEL